jgi:hypothetical protein
MKGWTKVTWDLVVRMIAARPQLTALLIARLAAAIASLELE